VTNKTESSKSATEQTTTVSDISLI